MSVDNKGVKTQSR